MDMDIFDPSVSEQSCVIWRWRENVGRGGDGTREEPGISISHLQYSC